MILKGIKRHIDCPSTIVLIKKILGAGYVLNEDLKKHGRKRAKIFKSDIGTPQGIVLSPLFNNIVLHELDAFIENEIKRKFVRGRQRKANLFYRRLTYKIKNENNLKNKQKLLKQRSTIPSKDPKDPNFFRLHYVRYVDDWVILTGGSLKETKVIKDLISGKLKSLGLTLNTEKTNIISLRKGKCRFLGIDFFSRPNSEKHLKPTALVKKGSTTIKQRFSPRIILQAPILKLLVKLKEKRFLKRNSLGEFFAIGKSNCIPLSHPQILNYFNSRIRGILNYYSCVHNRNQL